MSEVDETPTNETTGTKRSAATSYVVGSAVVAALVLGFTIFLLVRGLQWRGALAELRAEPGIEILGVERVGFFKKRLLGLRDPLANDPQAILRKHNIGSRSAELFLTEYHSLNTSFAIEREGLRRSEIEEVKAAVISAIAEFSETMDTKREKDLERITKMLFEARFPDAMESVDIEWKEDRWYAKGELFQPTHDRFVAEAPNYIVDGALDFSQLINLTESKTEALRKEIESTNLFSSDLDGEFVHVERIKRLVSTYDEICRISEIAQPRLQLVEIGTGPKQLEKIRSILTASEHITDERLLPDSKLPKENPDTAVASLKIIPAPAP